MARIISIEETMSRSEKMKARKGELFNMVICQIKCYIYVS